MRQRLKKVSFPIGFLVSAIAVGFLAVVYAEAINIVFDGYWKFAQDYPYVALVLTPALFLLAALVVTKFAPEAKGSGIPQVLRAIALSKDAKTRSEARRLVSLKTSLYKLFSTLIGFFGGASIGREGPTVQISASLFACLSERFKKFSPNFDLQSALIAGSAAGVAAAFNTPLAGIAFALEEIADGVFHEVKQAVMFSIIVAGITAQAVLGNYLYFGHPVTAKPTFIVVPEAIIIGLVGGLLGSTFAWLLASGSKQLARIKWSTRALSCGVVCGLLGFFSDGQTIGSGYEIVREFMEQSRADLPLNFGLLKFMSTISSYLSGIAGGIFSPCLSIGCGFGYTIGKILAFTNLKTCALIGMVAFFSGVVQAPLTAVVIVMEMTNEHIMIIPFMIAALLAQGIGKILMPVPLYHLLAHEWTARYLPHLPPSSTHKNRTK